MYQLNDTQMLGFRREKKWHLRAPSLIGKY